MLDIKIRRLDAASQCASVWFGEALSRPRLLAEITIGLSKAEAVRDDAPLRRGLLHRLADVQPAAVANESSASSRPSRLV